MLKTVWEFSRPHTIVGSFFSITSLYALSIAVAYSNNLFAAFGIHLALLLLTLVSALTCNIYITGLNQIMDLEIDRINKPWLPIPAGKLSIPAAKTIVILAGIVALFSAWIGDWVLFILILLIMILGTTYSIPPFKFKRHHMAAAASILLVRGLLVNIGMPIHFLLKIRGQLSVPDDVWPITFFVTAFSLAIAWFKDIPDTEGDLQFRIRTLAISLSPKAAFISGVAVVALGYIGLMLLGAGLAIRVNQPFFFLSHSILLLAFLAGASQVQIKDREKFGKFYLIFWGFFFVEYLVYAASYYLNTA